MIALENLKQLVLEGGFDEDSRNNVLQLEQRVQQLVAAENLQQHLVIQQYTEYLRNEVERCTSLLATDRKLTELERAILFEKRDLCKHFLSLFDLSDKPAVEQEIKDLLDVAKNT